MGLPSAGMCQRKPIPALGPQFGVDFFVTSQPDGMHGHVCANAHVHMCAHLVKQRSEDQNESFPSEQNSTLGNPKKKFNGHWWAEEPVTH